MVGRKRIFKDPVELIVKFATNSKKFNELYHKDPFLYDEFIKRGVIVESKTDEAFRALNSGEQDKFINIQVLATPSELRDYRKVYDLFMNNIHQLRSFYQVKKSLDVTEFYDDYKYDMKKKYHICRLFVSTFVVLCYFYEKCIFYF